VKNALLKPAYRLKAFGSHPLVQATPYGGICVRAKVKAVVTVDSFEQQLDLDTLELGLMARARGSVALSTSYR
jgi:hypothetical protein